MICQICNRRRAEHKHHLFSNTKLNRKLYGKLLEYKKNVISICSVCHLNKSIPKYNEIEFCWALGIEPRSKSGKELWKRFITNFEKSMDAWNTRV